jgi:hypothetical protein
MVHKKEKEDKTDIPNTMMKSINSNDKEKYPDHHISEDNHKDGCKIDHFSSHDNTSNKQIFNSEGPTQKLGKDELLGPKNAVGAFSIAGIGRGMNELEEQIFPDDPNKDQASMLIMSVRLIDIDIVKAVRLESPNPKPAMRKRFLFLFLLMLFLNIICLIVFLLTVMLSTHPNLNQASNTNLNQTSNLFLETLKPLLTDKSRQELEVSESVPSLALNWLLEHSNFNAYSLDRQIQRFALAVFYYTTEGRTWNQTLGWLTDDDECTWYQDSNEDLCVNGTLRVLSLQSNNLIGLIPNEIALFSSLEVLDLALNGLTGSIPMEVQNLTSLIYLHLQDNYIDGTIPTEVGALNNLQQLELYWNNIFGEIPSEIGECTELILMDLEINRLNGSIPSEIG